MQRKGEFFCLVGGLLLLCIPLKNHFIRSREVARNQVCQNNLKQMGIAIAEYEKDFDGRYPPVDVNSTSTSAGWPPYGWFDSFLPYIRSTQVNYCPSAPDTHRTAPSEPTSTSGMTDYWFNSNVAGLQRRRLPQAAATLMVGDGNDGTENTNARYHRNSLPPNYSPGRRHLDGANYLFADSHVKWLRPEAITTTRGLYTFAAK